MIKHIALSLFLLLTYGCSGTPDNAQDSAPAPDDQAGVEILSVAVGQPLLVQLEDELSTETNASGDTFSAVLLEPVMGEDRELIPAGARVTGRVVNLVSPEGGEEAGMTLELTEVWGYRVATNNLILEPAGSTEKDLEKVAVGGVAGGVIGGILGGSKGAVVGAGAGAGAGAVVAILTRDDQIHLDPGQKMRFELVQPLQVTLDEAS